MNSNIADMYLECPCCHGEVCITATQIEEHVNVLALIEACKTGLLAAQSLVHLAIAFHAPRTEIAAREYRETIAAVLGGSGDQDDEIIPART